MENTRVSPVSGRLDDSDEPLLGGSAANAKELYPRFSNTRLVLIVCGLVGISFSNSMSNGLMVVGVPYIASDLHIPNHLLLWYECPLFPIGICLRLIAKMNKASVFILVRSGLFFNRQANLANRNYLITD